MESTSSIESSEGEGDMEVSELTLGDRVGKTVCRWAAIGTSAIVDANDGCEGAEGRRVSKLDESADGGEGDSGKDGRDE